MMQRIFGWLIFFALSAGQVRGQELQANVTVLSNRIGSGVDKRIFQTLQTALYDFLNSRKWTSETFGTSEKIACNFLLNLSGSQDNNTYSATLTVQAGRPIFNSSYQSPLINFMDESVSFRYIQYQSLDFNDNRVQGTDPVAANLTAIFAYYVYTILGLDFDSFALRGGDPYFQKALNIVNNAPEGSSIAGWKPFDGVRNRYWLIENLTNTKYNPLHDAIYNYYRQGLDKMYDHENDARQSMLSALISLNDINTEFPNIMFMQFFFQGKGSEISNVFKKGTPDEKSRALDLLTRLDVSNLNRYKQDLQ
ncbi:MAG: DUF4835 family protein [Bacteroidota bacterium]|nr:DUF4835 family protein [Bacteroidota bacterium]MDP4213035.1 DUF4835 family protein [Bacteroidota bacterium]